jgi:hypothetical protein
VAGVGHKAFDQAILQATDYDACFASVSGLSEAVPVYKIYDRITSQDGNIRQVIVGVDSRKIELIRDWQIIDLLNNFIKNKRVDRDILTEYSKKELLHIVEHGESVVEARWMN